MIPCIHIYINKASYIYKYLCTKITKEKYGQIQKWLK